MLAILLWLHQSVFFHSKRLRDILTCGTLLLKKKNCQKSCGHVSSLPFSGVCTFTVIAPSEARFPLTLRGGWCKREHHILWWWGGRGGGHRSLWHHSAAEHAPNTAHAQQQKHVSVIVLVYFGLCASLTFIFWHRWYTQQNPPRARTYSWSRNLRPSLDPQQRPGSAPLYGRFCYGIHTLPVLRDYPAGPLEAGLQLTQLTQGVTRGQAGSSLVITNQNNPEPQLSAPQMSTRPYMEYMVAKNILADSKEGSEAENKDAQNHSKVRIHCKKDTVEL